MTATSTAKKSKADIRTERHRTAPPAGLLTIAAFWPRAAENLGTLVRTCDALNATLATTKAGLAMLDRGDTIGWRKHAHVEVVENIEVWLHYRRRAGDVVAVEQAHGATPLAELRPAGWPTVLLLGHESSGIPGDILVSYTTDIVEIPMRGVGNSLNVAVAGSLVAYRLAGLS